mgnify:CR=1 FL=1
MPRLPPRAFKACSSVTINRGNASDTISVNALPDFNAGLTIGGAATQFASITFAGAVTLATNQSLTGFATGTISLPNAASDLAVSGMASPIENRSFELSRRRFITPLPLPARPA